MPRIQGPLAACSLILVSLVAATGEPASAAAPKWVVVARLGYTDFSPYKGPSVAAIGPKNVWAVDGEIHHWNGQSWKTVHPTGAGTTRFTGVVASSAHDVWFVTEADPTFQDVQMVHWN